MGAAEGRDENMKIKYLAMIQARCGSKRLPNKVLKDLCGKPALQRMIERVKRSRCVDEVMVITSISPENLPILGLCSGIGVRAGTGSEDDVLDRFYQNARLLEPEYVIRLTGDCPCIDPELIDLAAAQMTSDIDYCGMLSETFADGLDIEIIRFSALERAWKEAGLSYEREHVTQYIIHHPEIFKLADFVSPVGYFGNYRLTVDEEEDFEAVTRIYKHFLTEVKKDDFNYKDILAYLASHPETAELNKMYHRNEGLERSIKESRQQSRD